MSADIERQLRRFLFLLLTFGLSGLLVELIALGHYEDPWQLVPLGLIGSALVAMAVHAVRGGAATVRALRIIFVLIVLAGGLGIILHYRGNMEFQLDVNPDLAGWALFAKILHAKAPPALAPGAMAQLGLLGLVYTYRLPRR